MVGAEMVPEDYVQPQPGLATATNMAASQALVSVHYASAGFAIFYLCCELARQIQACLAFAALDRHRIWFSVVIPPAFCALFFHDMLMAACRLLDP